MSVDVASYIQIAKICQYLAADKESTQNLLFGGYIRPNLSRLLYIVRNGVQWLYTVNPADPTLDGKAIYMYSLCQPFVGQALQIIGSGGSGTIINPATGVISTILSKNIEFKVGDPGSPMNNGDTSLTLNYSFILNSSIIISVDGVDMPIGVTDRISFTPFYSSLSSSISFNNPVSTGQLYNIKFLQYISV
jgi:hypothetical protein